MWHLKHSKNSRNLKQISSRKGTLQSLIPFFYSQRARLPTGVKGQHWKGSVQFSAGARTLHFPAPPLEKDVYNLFLLPTAQFFIHAKRIVQIPSRFFYRENPSNISEIIQRYFWRLASKACRFSFRSVFLMCFESWCFRVSERYDETRAQRSRFQGH